MPGHLPGILETGDMEQRLAFVHQGDFGAADDDAAGGGGHLVVIAAERIIDQPQYFTTLDPAPEGANFSEQPARRSTHPGA